MAIMIPNDVEEFQTEGERAFYKFLQAVGKPDLRYVAWYLPDIKDKELDFLLFCEDIGLWQNDGGYIFMGIGAGVNGRSGKDKEFVKDVKAQKRQENKQEDL